MKAPCRMCGEPTLLDAREGALPVVHVACYEAEAATWKADDPRRAVNPLARERMARGVTGSIGDAIVAQAMTADDKTITFEDVVPVIGIDAALIARHIEPPKRCTLRDIVEAAKAVGCSVSFPEDTDLNAEGYIGPLSITPAKHPDRIKLDGEDSG